MKLVKKITAAVTAMAMAVGMMSVGASADTAYTGSMQWDLSFSVYPGMPSYITIHDYYTTDYLIFTSTYNRFHSICSYYSSGVDYQGKQAYAEYNCVSYKTDKTLKDYTLEKYHYGVSSNQNTGTTSAFVDNTSIVYGNYAKAFYSLKEDNNAQISATITGTLYFSNE